MRHSGASRRHTDEIFNPLRLVIESSADTLPPNPAVVAGVSVRWMGSERRRLEGEVTGFVYFADETRRVIQVDRRDLPAVLRNRGFVLGG